MSQTAPSAGFVYYSYGEPYLDETVESVRTLLQHNPTARVCVITDRDGKAYWQRAYPHVRLDSIIEIAINREEPFCFFRTALYALSPYDKTIALDSDTYIAAELHELFDLLDTFDFVAVPDEAHPAKGSISGLKGGYAALNYYNCGVLLFRKSPATQRLFERWKDEYLALAPFDSSDQASLVRALVHTEVRFITLPREYNLRLTNKCVSFQGRVKIIHGRARHPQQLIKMLNDLEVIDRGSRVWIPTLQRVIAATAFYPYGRLLKLLNLDAVQWSVSGRAPRTSVIQNVRALIRARAGRQSPARSREGAAALDVAVCEYLIQTYAIRSVFGYGSGAERCAKYFKDRSIDVVLHERKAGASQADTPCDVVWYGEDRPSVKPRHVPSFIEMLTDHARRLIILAHGVPDEGTFAQAGFDGPWVQLITDRGFPLNPSLSLTLRGLAQSRSFRQTGLAFERVVR